MLDSDGYVIGSKSSVDRVHDTKVENIGKREANLKIASFMKS